MFAYYSALLIITCSISISALTVIYYDDVMDKSTRNVFISAHITLVVIYVFDWLAHYLEITNSTQHLLTTVSTSIVIFLAPTITAVLAWGINDKKSPLLTHTVVSILALSFIFGFSGLFSDAIYYYDGQNSYHRGNYFFLYFILVLWSGLTLFINTYRLGVKYQNKNNFILILDLFLFLGALFFQYTFTGVGILWISYLIATCFEYIYYSSLVNQIDVLTGILNRKCYDSQLYNIKTNAIILFFDVNNFKEINDINGHVIGDYCLIEIATAIKEVYGKSGYCYRIGGDEFSVILHKNLESIEEFNSKFSTVIFEKKYKHTLPTVSVGYSYYYPNKTSIQKVIEEADMMMYQIKQESASIDTI